MKKLFVIMACVLPLSGFSNDGKIEKVLDNLKCKDVQGKEVGRITIDMTKNMIQTSVDQFIKRKNEYKESVLKAKKEGKKIDQMLAPGDEDFVTRMSDDVHIGMTLENDVIVLSKSNGNVKALLHACERPGVKSATAKFLQNAIVFKSTNCEMSEVTAGDVLLTPKNEKYAYHFAFFPIDLTGDGYKGVCNGIREFSNIVESDENGEKDTKAEKSEKREAASVTDNG